LRIEVRADRDPAETRALPNEMNQFTRENDSTFSRRIKMIASRFLTSWFAQRSQNRSTSTTPTGTTAREHAPLPSPATSTHPHEAHPDYHSQGHGWTS
jgi:hypothetical protein